MRQRLTIKDPHREITIFSHRVMAAGVIVAILLFLLVARLFYLQVLQHRFYMTLSQQNQVNLLPIEPKRGLIFDRHGILLAENTPVFSLQLIPEHITNLAATIKALQTIMPISDDDVHQFYKQLKQHRRYEPIPLRVRLTEQEIASFSVDQYRFPGVAIKAQLIRHYPFDDSLVPVLGYVGRINEQELQQLDDTNYSATHFIGKLGIEKSYEGLLHGIVGSQQVETDASGRIVRTLKVTHPISGDNLVLTLDSRLQQAAEEALGDESGAIVAIDPKNGDVLALVSKPAYDPNAFVQGISSADYQNLQTASNQPLYNRALRGQYPLGSTIKPFLGIEGLESGAITPDFHVLDPGWFKLPTNTHVYHDWKRSGHGWVNLETAIMQSCDTFFYTLAMKLGILRIDYAMHRFGFGQLTGIDVHEELPGLIPTPEWKRRYHGMPWFPGDTVISGIGQGFMLTTPLQLAMATATLANHGQGFQPHLVLQRIMPNGNVVNMQPLPKAPINISESTWQVVLAGMRGVVHDGRGTAFYLGQQSRYEMAAKTGTAQVFSLKKNQRDVSEYLPEHLRDNSVFIAFAPLTNPQIAIAVVVEHSKSAGRVAKKVLDAYLIKNSAVSAEPPPKVEVAD